MHFFIDPLGEEYNKKLDVMGKKNQSNKKKYAPMLTETRQILEDFYKPYNEKLAMVLDDDRFLWL